jgi:peptide/nickel transport system permease protein
VIGDKVWLTAASCSRHLILTYLVSIPSASMPPSARIRRRLRADDLLLSRAGAAELPARPDHALFRQPMVRRRYRRAVFERVCGCALVGGQGWDLIKHLWLPAFVLAWSAVAYQMQTVRATMSDELNKLSVTAARARGVPETRLLIKYPGAAGDQSGRLDHRLRRQPDLFGTPDRGRRAGADRTGGTAAAAYLDLDMYVAGAILLLLTFMIVFMNFLSDILLAWLDPRIKLGA